MYKRESMRGIYATNLNSSLEDLKKQYREACLIRLEEAAREKGLESYNCSALLEVLENVLQTVVTEDEETYADAK